MRISANAFVLPWQLNVSDRGDGVRCPGMAMAPSDLCSFSTVQAMVVVVMTLMRGEGGNTRGGKKRNATSMYSR